MYDIIYIRLVYTRHMCKHASTTSCWL